VNGFYPYFDLISVISDTINLYLCLDRTSFHCARCFGR